MKTIRFAGLIGITLLFLAIKCEKAVDNYIIIENRSNDAIYYLLSFYYPDTLLKKSEYPPDGNKILKHEVINNIPGDPCFEVTDTLIIFILNADTVETLPWDTIVERYLILKRYEVTKYDMERVNWTITYP